MIGKIPMRKFEHRIYEKELIAAMLDIIPIVHVGCNDDGWPYVVPLSYGYEITEEALRVYLHCAREGHKVELWRQDPRVTLTFSVFQNRPSQPYRGEIHDYRSVMAQGTIRRVSRQGKDSCHGRGVQAILRHNGRQPTQFSVPHYAFMDLYLVECPWEQVTAKAETPFCSAREVPFPTAEELKTGGGVPCDYAWFFNRKSYEKAPGRGESPPLAPMEPLAETVLPDVPVKLTLRWQTQPGEAPDCDLVAFVLSGEGKLARRYDLAFYNQKTDRSGAVTHLGDDILSRPGEESVTADLPALGGPWQEVLLFLSVYEGDSRNQHLGMLATVQLTVEDAAGAVLTRGALAGDWAGKGSALAARLTRLPGGGWRLSGPDGTAWDNWQTTALFPAFGLNRWRE